MEIQVSQHLKSIITATYNNQAVIANTPEIFFGPDYRLKRPTNPIECAAIQQPLHVSRVDWFNIVGQPPELTNQAECYAFQLSELEATLVQRMGLANPLLMLLHYGRWMNSDSWQGQMAARREHHDPWAVDDLMT